MENNNNWPEMAHGDEFNPHGIYTVSNAIGYDIELSQCGEGARIRYFDDEGAHVSKWLEIEYLPDEDGNPEFSPVIDAEHFNIPLSLVMRI